jgi:hypothetical protein
MLVSSTIAATSVTALRTGALPGWLGWAVFLVAIVALLRILGPLGAWLSLLWIITVSLLMVVGGVGSASGRHAGTVRSSWARDRQANGCLLSAEVPRSRP